MPSPRLSDQPFLTIYNRHGAQSGEPPHVINHQRGYYGYFQSEHGDQWLFLYDPGTRTAWLRCGGANWNDVCTVQQVEDFGFTMTESERAWALACWQAATTGSHQS